MDPQESENTVESTHSLLTSSAFLLHLIEPVRIYTPPSPPTHPETPARTPGEDTNSSEKLKRRLIDALAFICATEREGDAGAAAVCIEEPYTGEEEDEHEHGEYTLRIAKNGPVDEEVLRGVREIMTVLETFADGCKFLHPPPPTSPKLPKLPIIPTTEEKKK